MPIVKDVKFYKFHPVMDFFYDGLILEPYTVNMAKAGRLQISSGL